MKKRVLFIGVLVATLVSALAFAQQFGETLEVTVIEVPVTVLDRAGKPVTGLTKEDFEVTDDGKKVNLVGFEVINMSKTAVEDNATPLPPAAYRNFLLLFDLANSSPTSLGRAQTAAREFVATQLGRRDLAAVATFSTEQGMQVVTSFTSDRATLEHAVATLGRSKYFKVADPLRIAPPSSGMQASAGRGQATEGEETGAAVAIEKLVEFNEQSLRVNDEELRGRLRKQFNQFGTVARMLDTLRGQKQVILLSEGFDPKLVQGRQDLSAQATQQQNDAVLTGEIWKVDSDDRYGSASSSSEINQMGELFRRSDVTLHAVDIKGLRTDVDASAGVRKSSNESLHMLTRPTGGAVFKNANQLSETFTKLLQQQEVVYLLAFEARPEKPGKFHQVKVKVPKARGARISHRLGYYETSSRSSPLEQTLTLADIMMTDANVRDVPFTVASMPLPAKDGGARIPVVVEIPGPGMLEKITGNTVSATIFVYAFDEQYQIRDYLQQRISFDLAKSRDQLTKSGMRYVGMLNVPPGRYALKALARIEETGRVGFVRTDIDVPAATGPMILQPVFVNDRSGWINVAEPGKGANAAAAFTAAGRAFAPTSGPTLKSDGAYRVALFVHDTPPENLEITPAVIGPDGAPQSAALALVGRTPPDADGGAKVLLEFKPAKIAAGNYKLQLTVTPKGGQTSVVAVPFRVE
jgi:VWFA-related protein